TVRDGAPVRSPDRFGICRRRRRHVAPFLPIRSQLRQTPYCPSASPLRRIRLQKKTGTPPFRRVFHGPQPRARAPGVTSFACRPAGRPEEVALRLAGALWALVCAAPIPREIFSAHALINGSDARSSFRLIVPVGDMAASP